MPPAEGRAPFPIPQGEERRARSHRVGTVPPPGWGARVACGPPEAPCPMESLRLACEQAWQADITRGVAPPFRATEATLHRHSAHLGERLATADPLASRREDRLPCGRRGRDRVNTRSCRRMGSRRLPTFSPPHKDGPKPARSEGGDPGDDDALDAPEGPYGLALQPVLTAQGGLSRREQYSRCSQ